MKYTQKDFIIKIENDDSPIIISVPHGGVKNSYGSWLNLLFKERAKSENPNNNEIKGEKVVLGGDSQILHVVSDILKRHQANAVIGLLPRLFVDYNRFVPEVAYADEGIKPFYEAYHSAISETIERLSKKWNTVCLFDFHGFGKQPIEGVEFDIILGSNGESAPGGLDKKFYETLSDKYRIFCAGVDGMPAESTLYKGDTSNLHYSKKYGIDAILVEISPKFRSPKIVDARINGEKLAEDLGDFLNALSKEIN